MIIRFLLWLSRHTPPRVITGRPGPGEPETPYLTQYFIFRHRGPTTEGMEHDGPAPGWGLYLHRFHRSDNDGALHNHPWRWAVSLVLRGGYSEERRDDSDDCEVATRERFALDGCPSHSTVIRREVRPWRLNFLTHRTFHRVDLPPGEDAWTLFLVGPVVQSWGFWDRVKCRFTPWKKYLGIES